VSASVADTKGRAQAAPPAPVNGAAGRVWAHAGAPRVVFRFTIAGAGSPNSKMLNEECAL
jgi:hypothetical protein